MAIQMHYAEPSGLDIPEAYIRCLQVNIGVDSTTHLEFGVYWNEVARRSGAPPIRTLALDLGGPDGPDPTPYFGDAALKQSGHSPLERGYAFAMDQPEFAGGKAV